MTHRVPRVSVAIGALAMFLAACGSSTSSDNGISGMNVSDIQTKVNAAVKAQKTFEVTGSGSMSGKPANLDIKVDMAQTKVDAQIVLQAGGTMSLQVANGHAYATLDQAIAASLGGGSAAGAMLAGKCIDFGSLTDSSNPLAASAGSFNQITGGDLFAGKTYTKGAVKTVNNVSVLPLTTSAGDEIDIATTGDPLPVQGVSKSGSDSTTLAFKNWGQAVNVNIPSTCVTMAQIEAQILASGAPTPASAASPSDTSGASTMGAYPSPT